MPIRESDLQPFAILRQRTYPEQIVGLGIYLLISLTFSYLCSFPSALAALFSFGMWALWRRYSLRILKIELAVFLSQFLFQTICVFEHSFIKLVALLLLSSNTLLAMLLFWKKEKLSGIFYVAPLIWVLYLAFINMIRCMHG